MVGGGERRKVGMLVTEEMEEAGAVSQRRRRAKRSQATRGPCTLMPEFSWKIHRCHPCIKPGAAAAGPGRGRRRDGNFARPQSPTERQMMKE